MSVGDRVALVGLESELMDFQEVPAALGGSRPTGPTARGGHCRLAQPVPWANSALKWTVGGLFVLGSLLR